MHHFHEMHCAVCHGPVRMGEHRVIDGHNTYHELCWLSHQPEGVALVGDRLR